MLHGKPPSTFVGGGLLFSGPRNLYS
jgi:hypothetical protein